jgi:ABC-type lipoprotein export system ATPase subunit
LDTLTGASIIRLLRRVVDQTGVTVVVASHDPNVHEAADWLFGLQDGRLVECTVLTGDELFKPPGRRGVGVGTF